MRDDTGEGDLSTCVESSSGSPPGVTRPGSSGRRFHAWRRGPSAGHAAYAVWRTLSREPLVHFLILAALLFVAYDLLSPSGGETIVVDQATIDRLVREEVDLLARPLTEEERQAMIETQIDDEILLREAYRRGFDQDAVVRQHLVQKMRLILGEDEAEPSETDLKAFLAANRERYRTPPTVTLQQVFYADPAAVPVDLLDQLRDGANLEALGDRLYMLGPTLARYSLQDLLGVMGPEVARSVFELPIGEWRGPLRSDRGVHFVRVMDHHPPTEPTFEELEGYLRQDWAFARQQEAVAAKLAELRANYRIVIEDRASAR